MGLFLELRTMIQYVLHHCVVTQCQFNKYTLQTTTTNNNNDII